MTMIELLRLKKGLGLLSLAPLLSLFMQSVLALTGKGISSVPSTVQTEQATIEFYGVPERNVPQGGWVQLTVPDEITVHSLGHECTDILNAVPCEVSLSGRTFQITTSLNLPAGYQFQFRVTKAITNPISIYPSSTFTLLTSEGESETAGIKLTATPGVISSTNFKLLPSTQTVGQANVLEIRARVTNTIPKGGLFFFDFPSWNSQNPIPSQRKTYIQGNEICEPIQVLSGDMTCDFINNRLIIYGGATADILKDSEIVFKVTGFRNPIDTSMVSGFKISTQIEVNNQYWTIDQGQTTLQVQDFAQLSQTSFDVRVSEGATQEERDLAGVVQELNQMEVQFYLPVPLNEGCQITIKLPSQYSVSTVSLVGTLQVFGFYREYSTADRSLIVDKNDNSFTIHACRDYVENNKVGIVYISKLRQPSFEKETESVKIQITNADGDKIAMVDSGVTFTPVRGEITVAGSAHNQVVQSKTSIDIQLLPQHQILMSFQPELIIEFPAETQISSPICQLTSIGISSITTPSISQPSCTRFQQTLTIKDFLPADYDPSSGNHIHFTIGEITNPMSTYQVLGLRITIAAQGLYAIDEFEGPIPWTLETGNFQNIQVDPQSFIGYRSDNLYTFTFRPDHKIPQYGFVKVFFPIEVTVPDYSYSQSSCEAVLSSGFPSEIINCEFTPPTDPTATHYEMKILNAFRRESGKTDQNYVFTVPGIRNPIQITDSNTFIYQTFTREGYAIDKQEGAQISMVQPAELTSVQVTLSSYTVSIPSSYDFLIVPSVPIKQSSFIIISFPDQITLPDNSQSLNCRTTTQEVIKSISCSFEEDWPVANSIRVQFELQQDHAMLNAEDRFNVVFDKITNPHSTKPTDSIQVVIVNSYNMEPINSKESGIEIAANNAFVVAQAAISNQHNMPGVETEFKIMMLPEHSIDVGGGILINYPPQVSPSPTTEISVKISISDRLVDSSKLYVEPEQSARAIFIANVIQNTIFEPGVDNVITAEIYGLRNPFTNQVTDSFKIQTFDFEGGQFTYFIDKVDHGLTIENSCSYPCQTCLDDKPAFCTSCYPLTTVGDGLPFLQLGKCVKECATSRYYNSYEEHCELCHPTCLTCEGNADACTSCGIGDFLYLHRGTCNINCPSGYIGDSNLNLCNKCADNCYTCSNTVNSCDSCDPSSAYPYLFLDSCVESCPRDISVHVDGVCVNCDATCKTCSGSPTACASCEGFMKFDPVGQRCTEMCDFETQIYIESTDTCEYCAENCQKCSGQVQTCTECKEGFVLNIDQTCKPECSASNQTAVDRVCKECVDPCATCSNQADYCTSCLYDFKLYLGQNCVQYCPPKYDESNSTSQVVCIYKGLECPARFEVNANGDGCVPIEFECKDGYEINEAQTACVPKPGSPVPFPFILGSVFMSFLVLGSYIKQKFFTKVLTSLIYLIGSFELIMYGLMVGFAAAQREYLIMTLAGMGATGLILSNIAFTFYYNRDIVGKDQVYEKWLYYFPRIRKLMPWACLLLNFKCSKMLYSGFYGMESCMVRLGKHMVFYRIMRMVTYFSFVFSYGFIYLADAIIFMRVPWGYQLLILGIETAFLQTLIIYLSWRESKIPPDQLVGSGKSLYTSCKVKSSKVLRVKSGIEGSDSDYEEGIPDVDELTLIRSKDQFEAKENNLRKDALSKLISHVAANHGGVDIGAGLEHCMTTFDPNYLRNRRAFSMDGRANTACGGIWDEAEQEPARKSKEHFNWELEFQRPRRYSWPMQPEQRFEEADVEFQVEVDQLREANNEYLIDNVYTDVKPKEKKKDQQQNRKTISRRTQTYLRDLLFVDGEPAQESDMEVLMDDEADLFGSDGRKSIEEVKPAEVKIKRPAVTKEPVQKKEPNKEPKKKPVQEPSWKRPDFKLEDILGDFDIDDLGNFIIVRGREGDHDLYDKQGRRVNRRGYLIDMYGNVINHKNEIVFRAEELDQDDEIPAPYGYEKNKKNLINITDNTQVLPVFDSTIEEVPQIVIQRSSEESPDEENISEVNALIEEITKEKVPKRRRFKSGAHNLPPKVIKSGQLQDDKQKMFQFIAIDYSEQQRLARFAEKISVDANKIAQTQNESLSHFLSDADRLEGTKQSQLNDIINSSVQGAMLVESRMQRRPISGDRQRLANSSGYLGNASKMAGKAIVTSQMKQRKENANLQRIYGNIDDLVGLEEHQITQLTAQQQVQEGEEQYDLRGRRGTSGHPDSRRLEGLEQIYMNKIALNQSANINMRRVSESKPFRPTMIQYMNDPIELTAHTKMEGTHYFNQQIDEISAGSGSPTNMEDRIQGIQNNYIPQQQVQTNIMQKQLQLHNTSSEIQGISADGAVVQHLPSSVAGMDLTGGDSEQREGVNHGSDHGVIF